MPRNPYPGKKITLINTRNDYFETLISFEQIYNNPKINNLKKPVEQGYLDENKVKEMIEEYKENPLFLRFKNRIIIGNLNDTWYIVDGQHRLEMARQIYY